MSLYLKIILILFGLAYLISPIDLIPDLLLPFIGWIDDGVVIATIVYLIRYGRLPSLFFKKSGPFQQPSNKEAAGNFGHSNQGKTASGHIPKTPYEILGIDPNASKKEIRTAYKEAIKRYHPDKVSHLGEEFSNLASEKFLEIQTAYDTLMAVY